MGKIGCSVSGGGLSIGTIITAIISYTTWKSIGWCILHAILGWIYVIYYLFMYKI